jgi:hypothetical protein
VKDKPLTYEEVTHYANKFENLCNAKDKEIERLNNIIKEVREFIEDDRLYMSNGNVLSIANTGCGQKMLEILKGSDKE